jgi:hypothetical protein
MADRYWVGGTAIWDATAGTKWSTTSGGAGGASVPTSADDVYIDVNSGVVTVTVTNALASCRNLSFTSPAGDFAGTFAGPVQINISGSLTLVQGMTRTFTGALLFNSTTAQTIRCNGISLDSQITFNGVAGSWALQDNLTNAAARTVTLTNGSIALGANTLSTGLFSSTNTNTRTLDFGTGKILLSGNNATVWNTADVSTMTVAGSRTVDLSYAGATGTRTITASSVGFSEAKVFDFSVTAGTDTVALGAGSRARSFNLQSFSGTLSNGVRALYGSLVVGAATTLSSGTGATTFAATTTGNQITTSGKTFDFPLSFDGAGGSWDFQDALTQGSTRAFTVTNGTVRLKNGVTSTVGAFSTSGANQKFLESTLAGSQATLSQASGTVNASNLTIKDINATGGATWNAYVTSGNVDGGNNTGWDFFLQLGKYIYTRRKNKRILI